MKVEDIKDKLDAIEVKVANLLADELESLQDRLDSVDLENYALQQGKALREIIDNGNFYELLGEIYFKDVDIKDDEWVSAVIDEKCRMLSEELKDFVATKKEV